MRSPRDHWPEFLFIVLAVIGGSAPSYFVASVWLKVTLIPVGSAIGIGCWCLIMLLRAWLFPLKSGDELTIEELIQVELCAAEAIVDKLGDNCDPLLIQNQERLTALLEQLRSGKILPADAEVQLQQMREADAQWLTGNRIPPA